jgi:ABC-type branched-subunit amino acid transport system substrate-binding protein
MRQISFSFLVLLSSIIIVCGCSSEGGGETGDTIVIGAVFEDDIAEAARLDLAAVQLAIEEINESGVFDRKFKLVNLSPSKGDAVDTEKAKENAKQLYDEEKAVTILSRTTVVAGALVEVSNTDEYENMVQCSGRANGPFLNLDDMGGDFNDNFYRTVVGESFQLDLGIKLTIENSWYSIGLYRILNTFGAGISLLIQQTLAVRPDFYLYKDWIHADGPFDLESNKETMDEIIAAKQDANIDVTLVLSEAAQTATIVEYLVTNGHTGPVWIASGAKNDDFFLIAKSIGNWTSEENYVFGIEGNNYGGVNSQNFINNYSTAFGEEPSVASSTAYDCVYAVALALLYSQTGKYSSEDVKAGLQMFKEENREEDEVVVGIGPDELKSASSAIASGKQVDFNGASESLVFTGNGDRPKQAMNVFEPNETANGWTVREKYNADLEKVE